MGFLEMACTALVLLAWGPRALVAQTCPQNAFYLAGVGDFYQNSTAPSMNWAGMTYDHVGGTYDAEHTGEVMPGSHAGVIAEDRYRIVGPALASPIPIQVRVRCTGEVGGDIVLTPSQTLLCLNSRATLRIASGDALDEEVIESQYGTPCASRTIDHTVSLDLLKLPGEEFTVSMTMALFAGYTLGARAAGRISFVGLPPGYSIQSCQGYTGAPVATARRTWGDIKRRYR